MLPSPYRRSRRLHCHSVHWLAGGSTALIPGFEAGPSPAWPCSAAMPLDMRSICPQELRLLASLGGLRLVERFGDWSGQPFDPNSPLQLCICEPA